MWGLNQKLGSPAYTEPKSTQITPSCEKWWGFSLPEMDGWRCREVFKGPMHKVSFAATYRALAKEEGAQSGLEMLEERLRMMTLGRGLRE